MVSKCVLSDLICMQVFHGMIIHKNNLSRVSVLDKLGVFRFKVNLV